MRTKVIFFAVLAALFSISPLAQGVEFGPNSASITNPYSPMKVGTWSYAQGIGPGWANRIFYIHAIGKDVVSGATIDQQVFNDIKALKVNVAITDDGGTYQHEFFTMYFAQDTVGNVWLLKVYAHMSSMTTLLGGPFFKSMFMPAVPMVGKRAGIMFGENDATYDYCEIAQVGINSVATNYRTYDNCFKVHCYDGSLQVFQVEYYCQDIGSVRTVSKDNPSDVMDLKELGTTAVGRTVVIPLMD